MVEEAATDDHTSPRGICRGCPGGRHVVTLLLSFVTSVWGPSERLRPPSSGRVIIPTSQLAFRTSGCARHPQGTGSKGQLGHKPPE